MAIVIDEAVYRIGVDQNKFITRALLVAGSDGIEPKLLTVNASGQLVVHATTTPLTTPYTASWGSDDLAADTYYFPSSSGFDMEDYASCSVMGVFTTSGAATTFTVESRNTDTGAWMDITKAGYDSVNDTASVASKTDATGNFSLDFDNLNKSFIRFKLVTDHATNTNQIDFRAI